MVLSPAGDINFNSLFHNNMTVSATKNIPISSSNLGPIGILHHGLSPILSYENPLLSTNSINIPSGGKKIGDITVVIGLNPDNKTLLLNLLNQLSNPKSPYYHHYLSKKKFDQKFGGNQSAYNYLLQYFNDLGVTHIQTFSDKMLLKISGNPSVIMSAFNTSISFYHYNGKIVYGPSSKPELPLSVLPYISGIAGFSNYSSLIIRKASLGMSLVKQNTIGGKITSTSYIQPPTVNGVQYIYGSDMQVANGEQTLFKEYGYPSNGVTATILWSGVYNSTTTLNTKFGTLKPGQYVGPFDPTDIYTYFNETIPSWEPHSHVYGVPIGNASAPGPLASYDTTGANFENTLDLEMLGSTAPGSSIYNVYANQPSISLLDSAFSFILNPNASFKGLDNVSVISNSWGGQDSNNTLWYNDLLEAQARGITVLASSGDAGDNPSSKKYSGSNTEFPSSMAFNTFGMTAVGATTVKLSNSLSIINQTNWYVPSSAGGPYGTSSGISSVFPEPVWQKNSLANVLINGQGRGVPDISTIGNNTLITITVNGYQYDASNATFGGSFYPLSGTSVSSPLAAGIILEINHVLNVTNESNLGFIDPILYKLGSMQYEKVVNTSTTGYYLPTSGSYNSSLPSLPFSPVTFGRNHVYNDRYGYSLLNGWGSLNAYNFTGYVMHLNFKNIHGAISGVDNNLSLRYLKVTSYNSTGAVYTTFNASIQQNMFIANEMGQPLYWIQNVIYIVGSNATGFTMNYTGWVIYPFYGIYQANVYEYNFPIGFSRFMPHDFNISTLLNVNKNILNSDIEFTINSHTISLPVPGAAYIIGSLNYTYYYGNQTYYNGPYPNNSVPGGLAPEFGLVGGPSATNGSFQSPTSGEITNKIKLYGTNTWITPKSLVFSNNIDQTGEIAYNLYYSQIKNGSWNVSIKSGSTEQGILSYEPPSYKVNFIEKQLPSGIPWYVNVTGQPSSGPIYASNYSMNLQNGNYTFSVGTSNKVYHANGSSFTVNNANLTENVVFSPILFNVSFRESGLPSSTGWYVNLSNNVISGQILINSYVFSLTNGTYSYFIGTTNISYGANGGTFTVNGSPKGISINFKKTYSVVFKESNLPSGNLWYVNISQGFASGPISVSSFSFLLINGTYSYIIGTPDKIYHAKASSFNVNGNSTSEQIIFSKYNSTVTFNETNLPPRTGWFVNITGEPSSGEFFTPTYSLNLTNNSFTYSIGTVDKLYHASGGSFIVKGQPIFLNVSFSKFTYNIQFNETSLPTGTSWYINLSNGYSSGGINGNSFTFQLSNGSYSYTIGTAMKIYHANGGKFNVTGSVAVETIAFVKYTYSIQFNETNLPLNNTWYVNLSNGVQSGPIHNMNYTFLLVNGTYTYNVGSSDIHYKAIPGNFAVNGRNTSVKIMFYMAYSTTFYESGLPSGTTWFVNLSDKESSGGVTGSTTVIMLINGTYNYTIGTENKIYHANGASFKVNGNSSKVQIQFYKIEYSVIFNEHGLPPGTMWYMNITAGQNFKTSSSSIEITVTNGTYSFNASSIDHYIYKGKTTFTVNGNNISLTIDFTSPPGVSPINNSMLINIIIVSIIIICAVAYLVIRRRK
ncbi:MAG: S53 family peptidase [Thermoplasmataceae archaeon]